MIRTNLVLLAILIVCAMSVISARHQSRKLYSDLQREIKFVAQLEVEYGRLQLEQSTWAAHGLIERAATDRLQMQMPEPKEIQVLPSRGSLHLPAPKTTSGGQR